MQKTIHINQLLIEREDHLVEIFELERQIGIVLGGASYPLEAPADLPSQQKRKKAKRKKPVAAKKPSVLRLRKLDPETESAYRVVYLQNDEEKTEIHTDPRPLALLANTPLPHVQVQLIETVQFAEENQWSAVETLFEAPGTE